MIKKTATRHGSLFFDKYQVISEMQEYKSAPKITPIVKICIHFLTGWATVDCDKTLVQPEQ
ncbi:hypothetical protein [Peribacillus frigoritolerans]|uniref:hypothetical protein n=1 Tax=Peribacillus frigoritolerans TaxID=450367 RepID=UPI00330633A9